MTDPTAADAVEPTGHTIDGTPWEEPRPPHLPDPIVHVAGRVPLAAWAFLSLAIAFGAWDLAGFIGIDLTATSVLAVVRSLIPTVGACLMAAALFARHPDARSAAPRIVFGLVLLIAVEVVSLGSGFLGGLFPSDQDLLGGPPPILVGIHALRGLLTAFAIVYLARGLVDARVFEDDPGASRRTRLIAVVAIAGMALDILLMTTWIQRGQVDLPGTYFLADTVATMVGLTLVLGAQAYLLATSWTGATSGEHPLAAWRWAAIGWGAIFAAQLTSAAVNGLATALPPGDQATSQRYLDAYQFGAWLSTLGWLAAIWAFVVGLPRLATGTSDDSDRMAETPADDVAAPLGAEEIPEAG